MSIHGAKGVAIGPGAIGDDAIVVFVVDESAGARLPAESREIDAYRSLS